MENTFKRINRHIFISVKEFMKKHMNSFYSFVRYWILMFAVTYRRQRKLKSLLKKDPFFHFNYKDISFLIALDPKNGYVDEKICDDGVFEPEMLDEFIKYIHDGMTFADIGANIGQHTLFASRLVGENGHVISFEPIPHLYEQIKKSVEGNKMHNVKVINAGCGNREETLNIYMDSSNLAASSLIIPNTTNKLTTTPVHIIRPEPILLPYKKIDVIKIDVEGYEYQTLLGLEKILERDKPVIFLEYTPTFYEKNKGENKEHDGLLLLAFLQKHGYKIKDLEGKYSSESKDLVAWGKRFDELTKHLPHRQTNIICTVA